MGRTDAERGENGPQGGGARVPRGAKWMAECTGSIPPGPDPAGTAGLFGVTGRDGGVI